MKKYVILVPVYNDRESLKILIENINEEVNGLLTRLSAGDGGFWERTSEELTAMAAEVARKRLARGVKLNYPEAIAIILAAALLLPCVAEAETDARALALAAIPVPISFSVQEAPAQIVARFQSAQCFARREASRLPQLTVRSI